MRGNHAIDNLFAHVAPQLLDLDLGRVLGRYDDRRDPRDPIVAIFDADLRLAVRSQICQFAALTRLRQTRGQLVRERNRHRHQFRRLVARIAEHHALIPRAGQIVRIGRIGAMLDAVVHAERDVGGLLIQPHQDGARIAVESLVFAVVADLDDRLARDRLVIDLRRARDFAHHQRESGIATRLQRHARHRILRQQRVQYAVRNLVADLVGMTFRDALAGK